MRYIEASQLISTSAPLDAAAVKYALVERLRDAFHVETVGEGAENFSMTMAGKGIPYRCALHVTVSTAGGQKARIIMGGTATVTPATKISYALGILALLVLGLFPGTINTSGQGSGATDFLVFLFLGAFVLYDTNRKFTEMEDLLDRVLTSVETQFAS